MKEIEIKILEIDRPEIEHKLITMGGEKIFEDIISDEFYDTIEGNIVNEGSVLRLRKAGETASLTFKSRTVSEEYAKLREETETAVSSLKNTRKILEELGYRKISGLKKRRISYKVRNVRFEFDKLLEENDFVPEFLEIEAFDEHTVFVYASMLGFGKEECVKWNGKEVIDHYSKLYSK